MRYCIKWLRNGRLYEAFTAEPAAAYVIHAALSEKGFQPELWCGATKLR